MKHKNKVYILFFITVTIPTFQNSLGSKGIMMVYIAQILWIFSLWSFNKIRIKKEERKFLYYFAFIYIVYGSLIAFSSLYTYKSIILRDLYDLYRPISYLLIISSPFVLISRRENIRLVYYANIFCIVLVLLFSINHFFGFVDEITKLYTKNMNINTRRISTPFVNPYDMGFYMLFCIPFSVFGLYVDSYKKWFPTLIICTSVLLLTQSRSMVGAFIAQTAIIFCVTLYMKKRGQVSFKSFSIGTLLILSTSTFGVSFMFYEYRFVFSYLILGFRRVFVEGGDLGSLTVRLEQIVYALEKVGERPLVAFFGNGPSKSELEFVESSYVYFFFRYGVIGLVLFFFIPLYIGIRKSFLCLKRSSKFYEKVLFSAILVWFLTTPVASIGNNITEQVRLSFFYYFFIGFVVRSHSLMK